MLAQGLLHVFKCVHALLLTEDSLHGAVELHFLAGVKFLFLGVCPDSLDNRTTAPLLEATDSRKFL